MLNKKICLKRYPENVPVPDDFSCEESVMPILGAGQVLCKTHYLSLDPYMRSQIAGRHITASLSPGDMMQGETVSEVVQTNSDQYEVGQLVRCMGGWQEYSVHDAKSLSAPIDHPHPSYALSILGMPGLTAYAGLVWQANAKKGDVVVIPAAIGGVGATAGQLAKAAGCIVVGIAGSDDKCQYAISELGYDFCINRKTENIAEKLDEYCPKGIDVYFDLVGGELLHTASERLAVGARVILCGLIAEYNNKERMAGPPPALWIKSRATVYGLVVYDFETRREEFLAQCIPLVLSGKLKMQEDIGEGIESAPDSFCKLMRGENFGKTLVQVSK
ncbi:NADP-dependent oxidoreductase [Thalassotalea piscium]